MFAYLPITPPPCHRVSRSLRTGAIDASFVSVARRTRRAPPLKACIQPDPLLTDRDAQADFLRTTWGKHPRLFRNLLPFSSPLSPDDLAGLSTDSSYCRIIRGSGTGPYTLTLGPFTEHTFQTIGNKDWTLLVDHVNRFVPELSFLLDKFDFLPNWRLDDIMMSYAVPGGSVGPHVDNYDVFLLQGSGRRLWKTSYTPISHADERLVDGLDVRVLENGFVPDEEWILEPGDALYVPPRFPHHGISLDEECMTYSIGFRAPTVANLIFGWVERLVEKYDLEDRFYEDDVHDLSKFLGDPGQITKRATEKAFESIMHCFKKEEKGEFARWFAEELSQQRTLLDLEAIPKVSKVSEVLDTIQASSPDDPGDSILVRQREGSIFTYLDDSAEVAMYIDGEHWPVADVEIAKTICGKRCRPADDYAALANQHPSVRDLLGRLLEADILYVENPSIPDDEEQD